MTTEQATQNNSRAVLQAKMMRWRLFWLGLAVDFWKDGPCCTLPKWTGSLFKPREKNVASAPSAGPSPSDVLKEKMGQAHQVEQEAKAPQSWTADRLQIIETLWGEGHALPGEDEYLNKLSTPLGINKDMSILDLAAGFGDMGRFLAHEYGTYTTGMEPNAMFASRGMVMSIAAGKSKQASVVNYDPAAYMANRKYDCIFARELFYRIIGKEKFFKAVDASLKSGGGQMVFTDYILDAKMREHPAIVQWLAVDRGAAPFSMIETIKQWKGMGYDMRVAEDQTEIYKGYIVQSIKDFKKFMQMNIPDRDTKPIILREIDFWARRMEAFDHGLKYCRFYAIKY